VNWIGPHPYYWRNLLMSGAFLSAALCVVALAVVVSLSITNPPLKRIGDHLAPIHRSAGAKRQPHD
jgi:hypothetical protein